MDVAVARVHVQRDEDAAAQHVGVDRLDGRHHRLEDAAGEDLPERVAELALPRHAQLVQLDQGEDRAVVGCAGHEVGEPQGAQVGADLAQRPVEVAQEIGPAPSHEAHELEGLRRAVAEEVLAGDRLAVGLDGQLAPEAGLEGRRRA